MCNAKVMMLTSRILAIGVATTLGLPTIASAQPIPLEWSQTYSGSGVAEARGVAADGEGVYVTGDTQPEVGQVRDLILLKYDVAGNPVWDRTWGGETRSDQGFKVALFGNEVHVAGNTRRYTPDNEPDCITLKYDRDGVLDTSNSVDGWWTFFEGDAGYFGYDRAYDLALDSSGNLYVLGTSERAWNNTWAYLEQYDSVGVKQWHQHYGVPTVYRHTQCYGLVRLGNKLYAGGGQHPTGSDGQVMVLKHDTDGTLDWSYLWGDDGTNEWGTDVAVSGSDIYVTGNVGLSGDPNGCDVLLLKLHDNGDSVSFVDSTTFVGAGNDIGRGIEVTGGRVYIVGSTDVGGNNDALLLAYDTNLNPLWDYSWGGTGDDVAYDITYYDGTLYVTGIMDNEAFINAYTAPDPIPAVSEWGLVAMTLLVLAAGTVVLVRRRVVV